MGLHDRIPEHLRPVAERIRRALPQSPPNPWQPGIYHSVGGLLSVGFAHGSELLLVTSHSGRGVFDCVSGERVARDDDGSYLWESPFDLTAKGIGPLQGKTVPMAGIYGGGLATGTRDGWRTEAVYLDWPQPDLFLVAPGSDLYDYRAESEPRFWRIESGAGELRAWGFSSTGKTLLLATSADIKIFRRRAEAA
jgi:hypothetical protein